LYWSKPKDIWQIKLNRMELSYILNNNLYEEKNWKFNLKKEYDVILLITTSDYLLNFNLLLKKWN
jgi:hypothetical protein